MSSVNNISGSNPVQKLAPLVPVQKSVAPAATARTRAGDRVELSGVNHLLEVLKKNDIRADKVKDVRAQIDAGTYEDDKKLDVATSRLLDDLLK